MSRTLTYDWPMWFKILHEYRKLMLHQGRDYYCSTRAIQQQLRSQSSRRGIRLQLTEYDNWLMIEIQEVQR